MAVPESSPPSWHRASGAATRSTSSPTRSPSASPSRSQHHVPRGPGLELPASEYPPYDLALATRMAEVAEFYLDLPHVHYAIPHSVSALLACQMLPPAASSSRSSPRSRHRHHAGGPRPPTSPSPASASTSRTASPPSPRTSATAPASLRHYPRDRSRPQLRQPATLTPANPSHVERMRPRYAKPDEQVRCPPLQLPPGKARHRRSRSLRPRSLRNASLPHAHRWMALKALRAAEHLPKNTTSPTTFAGQRPRHPPPADLMVSVQRNGILRPAARSHGLF